MITLGDEYEHAGYDNSYHINNHLDNNESEIKVVSGIFKFNSQINMGKYELPNFR